MDDLISQQRIIIGLVHNGDSTRVPLARSSIIKIAEALDKSNVVLAESFYQSRAPLLTSLDIAKRLSILKNIESNWEFYKGNVGRKVKKYRTLLGLIFKCLIQNDLSTKLEQSRTLYIQSAVTSKHTRLWEQFVDSDAEYLICFEDDFVLKPDSLERLQLLLDFISKKSIEHEMVNGLYVDLAGGSTTFEKDHASNIKKIDEYNNLLQYSPPVTNTACVYLVSKRLAMSLVAEITKNPEIRLLPIDWLINQTFIKLKIQNLLPECWHSFPPIFLHGSACGKYKTWQKIA